MLIISTIPIKLILEVPHNQRYYSCSVNRSTLKFIPIDLRYQHKLVIGVLRFEPNIFIEREKQNVKYEYNQLCNFVN